MRSIALLIALFYGCLPLCHAQTVNEVLGKGEPIKKEECIFLHLNEKQVRYAIAEINAEIDYTTSVDSALFLAKEKNVPVFLHPYNPVKYHHNHSILEIDDAIEAAADEALSGLLDMMLGFVKEKAADDQPVESGSQGSDQTLRKAPLTSFTALLQQISDSLKKDQSVAIHSAFEQLEALSFFSEDNTKVGLENIRKKTQPIENHFQAIDDSIAVAWDRIAKEGKNFIETEILVLILSKLSEQKALKYHPFQQLKNAYTLADEMYKKASEHEGTSQKWCIRLNPIVLKDKKVHEYTLTVSRSGYRITDDATLEATPVQALFSVSFKVRKFQRFVKEPAAGMVWTAFDYNTYGTTTDSAGMMLVSATPDKVRNLKVSGMLNYNLYAPNLGFTPFFQIGAAYNGELPVLLTGAGLRLKIKDSTIGISGGISGAFVRELNKLQVGSVVNGSSAIDQDLIYRPVLAPKGYFGIQFNL